MILIKQIDKLDSQQGNTPIYVVYLLCVVTIIKYLVINCVGARAFVIRDPTEIISVHNICTSH